MRDLLRVFCASPAASCAAAAVLALAVAEAGAGAEAAVEAEAAAEAAVEEQASGARRDPGGLHGSGSAELLPAKARASLASPPPSSAARCANQ